MNLTQYKLLIGKDIVIDGVEHGQVADVSKLCGDFVVEGSILSKHNHDLESAMKLVESLIPDTNTALDNYTEELILSGVI